MPLAPTAIAGLSVYDASALSAGAVASWANAGVGPLGTFAGGGQTVVGNSLNGQNVVRFTTGDSSYLTLSTGGVGLNTTFYLAVVLRPTNVSQTAVVINWGDIALNGSGGDRALYLFNTQLWWLQNFSDSSSKFGTIAAGTAYLAEVERDANGVVTTWLNGVRQTTSTPTTQNYSTAPITLGVNLTGGEKAAVDIAYIAISATMAVASTKIAIRSLAAARYGLTVAGSVGWLPQFTSATTVVPSTVYEDANGNIIVGDATPLGTYTTGNSTPSGSALLSVYGAVAVYAIGAVHRLTNDCDDQNTVTIQNLNRTGGLSTAVGLDYLGIERWAMGRGNPSGDTSLDNFPFYPKNDGTRTVGFFFETSQGGDVTAACSEFVWVQTGSLNSITGYHRRLRMDASGNIILYAADAAFPNETAALTVTPAGSVKVGTTIATNATTGHFKLPTCAGTPTGVPEGGNGSEVYDTTNNKLYVYNGAWKATAALT